MSRYKYHAATADLTKTLCGRNLDLWLGGSAFRAGELTVEAVSESIALPKEITCVRCAQAFAQKSTAA